MALVLMLSCSSSTCRIRKRMYGASLWNKKYLKNDNVVDIFLEMYFLSRFFQGNFRTGRPGVGDELG